MVEKTLSGGLWPQMFDPLRQFGARVADWLSPAAEASSGDNIYQISLELPGVSQDDIEISMNDGVLTIKGEKKTSREEKGDTWFFSERQYGAFSRSFRLPSDADPDKVEAQLKDGVLDVNVPRRAAQKAEKKISIKTG